MRGLKFRYELAIALCLALPASATEPIATPAATATGDTIAPAGAARACPSCIPALTHVDLIFEDALSSKTSKAGESFRFRLAAPIMSGDRILVPAGTPGVGEVVFAKRSAFGGAAGELVLAARYLELGERRIKLRSMVFGRLGVDRVRDLNKAIVVAAASGGSLVAASTFFIYGSENAVKPGEAAIAKTAELVDLGEAPATPLSLSRPAPGEKQVDTGTLPGSRSGE